MPLNQTQYIDSSWIDIKNLSVAFACLLLIMIVLIFMSLPANGFAQQDKNQETIVAGRIMNKSGDPLELAHVQIEGTSSGDVTNKDGAFKFSTNETGGSILIISLIGFETERYHLNIQEGQQNEVAVVLKEKLLDLGEAEVTASAFTTGGTEGVTLSPLEVITTPGAAADIFRAIKSFPGVSTVDEGSGLFVRGGDVSETKILLDQATVVHPYKYETPTGGVFGTIPPFFISGTYFSAGGFSARYGNALSGVLAMESLGIPHSTSVDLNIGMAAASAGIAAPVIQDKLGIRFSGNRSFTRFMFEVNGLSDEFEQTPLGIDGNLSIIYKPEANTTFKLFNYGNRNEIGVRTEQPSFDGIFRSDESNRLQNLQWTQLMGNWLLKTSFSFNRFDSQSEMGGFHLDKQDDTYKIRSELEGIISESLRLNTGAEWEYIDNSFVGSVPDQEGVFDPNAGFTVLDEQFGAGRLGAYTELEINLFRRVIANIGLRSDLQTQTGDIILDPRVSLLYQFTPETKLRVATGLYHQFPEPFQYNKMTGNPDLSAQKAWHYILGIEHQKRLLHFRAEGYYKDYDNLIIDSNTNNLSNMGYGEAWGADIFIKYSEYLKSRFNGWISYSFLHSKRYQSRDHGDQLTFEYAFSDFAITHNLNVVGKVRLVDMLHLGIQYQYATGRPFTPITNSRFVEERDYYQPVQGSVNSQRLPNFYRLDIDLNYYWQFAREKAAIFYVSISNALNRRNVADVSYDEDYSQRNYIESNYSRFIYAGVSLNLGL